MYRPWRHFGVSDPSFQIILRYRRHSLVFDEKDRVFRQERIDHPHPQRGTAAPKLWSVPDHNPFRQMVILPHLAQELERVFERFPPQLVLERIWAEHQMALRGRGLRLTYSPVNCAGEFVDFVTVQYPSGRIQFGLATEPFD